MDHRYANRVRARHCARQTKRKSNAEANADGICAEPKNDGINSVCQLARAYAKALIPSRQA